MNARRVVGFLCLTASVITWSAEAQQERVAAPAAPIKARDIGGAGGWKTDGKRAAPMQRWDLQVTRSDDNSITGRVNLNGSPLAAMGNVHGHIIGSNVSGTITDDDGKQVATFHGAITPNGVNGKYTDRTGETGDWSWDGPPPQ